MILQDSQTASKLSATRSLTDSAKDCQKLALSLDIGNGAVKMFSAMGETLVESYIQYVNPKDFPDFSYCVTYKSGPRSDLHQKSWLGGEPAYNYSAKTLIRVTDDPTGKIDLGLQLCLSALAKLSHREEWNLVVMASVHDHQLYGAGMRKALEGTHSVFLNGKPSVVNIEVLKVVNEGFGAAVVLSADHSLQSGLIIDIGNGTSIVRSYAGLKESGQYVNVTGGVEFLIEAIAKHETLRRQLNKAGDVHLIRQGIERGDFRYGNTSISFKDIYAECVSVWLSASLKPLLREMGDRFASASAMIAIGGGVQLPGVAKALENKGFTAVSDSRWLNAKGLYSLALRGLK